jgi:hypothetical protein
MLSYALGDASLTLNNKNTPDRTVTLTAGSQGPDPGHPALLFKQPPFKNEVFVGINRNGVPGVMIFDEEGTPLKGITR